jgi:hypothetical protein
MGMEVEIHQFLISVPNVSGYLEAPAILFRFKSHQYPLVWKLGGPWSRSGRFLREALAFSYHESNHDYSSRRPVTIPTELFGFFMITFRVILLLLFKYLLGTLMSNPL